MKVSIVRIGLILCCFATTMFGQDVVLGKFAPLKSTRVTVEKLLGPPSTDNCTTCIYRLKDKSVIIDYSKSPCEGGQVGWNVAADTVLAINIRYLNPVKAPDLDSRSDYINYKTDTLGTVYANQEKGLVYKVDSSGNLSSLARYPLRTDQGLRCRGFSPYNLFESLYIPNATLDRNEIDPILSLINTFAIPLRNNLESTRLYVVFYIGGESKKAFSKSLNEAKRFIYKRLNLPADAVHIIDGGRAKDFRVDVFHIEKRLPPPVLP